VTDETTPTTDDATVTEDPAIDAESAAEARRRRTIIRLLVGFGVGIPVLIELATFVGLVEQSLLGDDGGGNGGGGTGGDATRTPDEREGDAGEVGVGDELLPETTPRETLSVASFRAGDDSWVLTLAAAVENTVSEPYTIGFGPVTTTNGRRVEGTNRAVTVAASETGQVTGTWQLSPGSRPAGVELRTATGDVEPTTHEVALARIPVEGR
jgi:hypothetical protein